MKHKEVVYTCDACGEYAFEESRYVWGVPIYGPPMSWKSVGKNTHLCPACYRALNELKEKEKNHGN